MEVHLKKLRRSYRRNRNFGQLPDSCPAVLSLRTPGSSPTCGTRVGRAVGDSSFYLCCFPSAQDQGQLCTVLLCPPLEPASEHFWAVGGGQVLCPHRSEQHSSLVGEVGAHADTWSAGNLVSFPWCLVWLCCFLVLVRGADWPSPAPQFYHLWWDSSTSYTAVVYLYKNRPKHIPFLAAVTKCLTILVVYYCDKRLWWKHLVEERAYLQLRSGGTRVYMGRTEAWRPKQEMM